MYKLLHRTLSVLMVSSLIFSPVGGYADVVMPDNGTIVDGTGSIGTVVQDNVNGTAVQTITQTSDRMIANWNSFSIGSGGTVTFIQHKTTDIALNRVTGGTPSEIYGSLSANGRIFLVNPNGILFGVGSHADTMGLLASTLDITDADFMAGKYNFAGTGGSIVNAGTLSAPGGFVALLGSSVENSCVIAADLGTIALASGSAVTLGLDSQNIISLVIDQPTAANPSAKEAAVANLPGGSIKADGGRIYLTAQALDGLFDRAINNEGVIEAGSLDIHDGVVELSANGDIRASGTISAAEGIKIVSEGDVLLEGGSVNVAIQGSGISYIDIRGENITLDTVSLSVLSLGGNFNWAYAQFLGGNSVRIIDSHVLSRTSSTMDEAQVYIQGRYITLDASELVAEAVGNSDGSAKIFLGHDPEDFYLEGDVDTEDISIINGSTLRAEIANGNSQAQAIIETDLTGTLESEDSSFYAGAGTTAAEGFASADIKLNLFGEGAGNVILSGSGLSAEVSGEGQAHVLVYGSGKKTGFPEFLEGILGWSGSGPVNGSIIVEGSTISSRSNSLSSFLAPKGDPISSAVGMMSQGPISIVNSAISATENNSSAVVGLLSGANISLDGTSSIGAVTSGSGSLAVIGMLALGTDEANKSLDIAGSVSAAAGDGIGVVGLLGPGDVNAIGTVTASGKADWISLIYELLSGSMDLPSINLGLPGTWGSAVLLASMYGDVTLGNITGDLVGVAALLGNPDKYGTGGNIIGSSGLVRADLLLMLASRNIGSSAQPINTDVDVVAAISSEEGDIFLNEANDIALGLFVPVSVGGVNWTEAKTLFSGEEYTFDLGIGVSVAAADGIIHVESQGDMVVNSVISPNGGVYLKSFNGSIYAGQGWDPTVYCGDGCGWVVDELAYELYKLGVELPEGSYGIIQYAIEMLVMRNPFVPDDGESSGNYFSPVFIGEPYDGPHVIAGGYSYFSTPSGTIGVGYPSGKNPGISGQVLGVVRPGATAATGLNPSVDLDLSQGVPPGLVFYDDNNGYSGDPLDGSVVANSGPKQVWPETPVVAPAPDNINPLKVHIDVLPDSHPAVPLWLEALVAGLTLQIGSLSPQPPQPQPPLDAWVARFLEPLGKNFRAYYEVLKNFRVVSFDPLNPTNFYAYHPLVEADTGAFDGINLDQDAYQYIDGKLNYSGNVSPYLEAGK